MSTTDSFQAGVFATIKDWASSSFPGVPFFYENGPLPEESKVGAIWVDVEVRWFSAKLASVGERPLGRHSGTVSLQVYAKEASGTRASGAIVDSAIELLRSRRLGGGVFYMPQRSIPTNFQGWAKVGVLAPFTLDSA